MGLLPGGVLYLRGWGLFIGIYFSSNTVVTPPSCCRVSEIQREAPREGPNAYWGAPDGVGVSMRTNMENTGFPRVWDTIVWTINPKEDDMQFKLSAVAAAVAEQCGTVVSSAVNAENSARDKWSKAGKALYKAGARVEALTKGTKDEPNPAQDDSLIETVERMIIDACTASFKPFKFDGGSYTFGELINMTREALREADDKVLSQTRRSCQQQVGSLFGLIRRYVDRVQNPDKERGTKGKGKGKAEPKAETTDPIVIIQGYINQATKLVDVIDVDRFQNAGLEMIALMRKWRK